MKIQDLKDNKQDIINFITLMNYDLKFAMEMSVEICENCDNIDELKEELQFHCKPVKESKIAAILGKLAEIEIENN